MGLFGLWTSRATGHREADGISSRPRPLGMTDGAYLVWPFLCPTPRATAWASRDIYVDPVLRHGRSGSQYAVGDAPVSRAPTCSMRADPGRAALTSTFFARCRPSAPQKPDPDGNPPRAGPKCRAPRPQGDEVQPRRNRRSACARLPTTQARPAPSTDSAFRCWGASAAESAAPAGRAAASPEARIFPSSNGSRLCRDGGSCAGLCAVRRPPGAAAHPRRRARRP